MSRYIDADALIDRLDYCVKEGMGSTIAFTFKHMVEDAPSIDIVRCKECKHASDNKVYGCMCNHFNDNDWAYHRMYADDFCSYGVKKGADDE